MKMACVGDHEDIGLIEAEGRTGKQSWLQIAHGLLRPKGEIGLVSLGIKEISGFLSQEIIR